MWAVAPQVIERTLRAALQIHYPPDKLRVHLLDDGGSMAGREVGGWGKEKRQNAFTP